MRSHVARSVSEKRAMQIAHGKGALSSARDNNKWRLFHLDKVLALEQVARSPVASSHARHSQVAIASATANAARLSRARPAQLSGWPPAQFAFSTQLGLANCNSNVTLA